MLWVLVAGIFTVSRRHFLQRSTPASRHKPKRLFYKDVAMSKHRAASAADHKPSISERAVANIAKLSDGTNSFSRGKYFDEVLFGKNWRGWGESIIGSTPTAAKLVALAISHYANGSRGSTYVDPLTIAKALGIKHKIVVRAIHGLRCENHIELNIARARVIWISYGRRVHLVFKIEHLGRDGSGR
jgi:hypothetical protein